MTSNVRLGDILEVQNGFAFRKEFFHDSQGVPLIRIRDLDSNITETCYNGPFREEFIVEAGDYLIGMDGGFTCRRWCGPRALLNQRVCRLRNFKPNVLPDYVYFGIQPKLDAIESQTSFVTVKHISAKQIGDIRLPLPSIGEQRRVVEILTRADGIVRLRREAQQKIAAVAPSLFLGLFGDPEKNQKGWPLRLLGDVAEIVGGASLPDGERNVGQLDGVHLLKVGDMNLPGNEIFLNISKEWTEKVPRGARCVPPNTVVLPKRGASIATNKKRLTTRASILDPNLMGVLGRSDSIDPLFLYQWFCHFDLAKITSGTTVPQLNKGDLAPLKLFLPPLELQKSFADSAVRLIALGEQQENSLRSSLAAAMSLLYSSFGEGKKPRDAAALPA